MKENTKGEKIACVESIKKPEDEVRYVFPPEYQTKNCHPQLFNSPTVRKAANSLTKVGHYRNIALTLDDETAVLYIDAYLNFAFRDIYLEEADITPTRKMKAETEKPNLEVEKLLKILQKRDKRWKEEINFDIKPFDGTQKAMDWILDYEEECRKNKIESDEGKAKGLKKYL
jgi:hypothetical protein